MNVTKYIPNKVTQFAGKHVLTVQKHSPSLLFTAGVVGVVTGTVLACRATLQLEDILDETTEDVESIKNVSVDQDPNRKDIAYAYAIGTYRIAKLYAVPVGVTAVSIAALTSSHTQLTRRNTALTAAYAGVHRAYDEYRTRVREELGEEKERDLYFGVVEEKVKGADGKNELVKVVDPNGLSVYARFFDETSVNWTKEPELNRLFVQCQQNYFNQLLHARGYVFLNEVYEALGMEWTPEGQIVGWMINQDGDNFIDFGMFDARSSRFVNHAERSVLLDFNVDGVIFDKLG